MNGAAIAALGAAFCFALALILTQYGLRTMPSWRSPLYSIGGALVVAWLASVVFVDWSSFRIEAALLDTLADAGVTGHRVRGAPGIYVRLDDPFGHAALPPVPPGADPMRGLGKIAALGIKVSRHCTFHGLALNVAMDLEPFGRINPCGYAGLRTVDLASLGVQATWDAVAPVLGAHLQRRLAP